MEPQLPEVAKGLHRENPIEFSLKQGNLAYCTNTPKFEDIRLDPVGLVSSRHYRLAKDFS